MINEGDGADITLRCDDIQVGNSSIPTIALSQVGTLETPNGSNCNPYSVWTNSGVARDNGCEPGTLSEAWCSAFAKWVWDQAGIDTSGITSWAQTFQGYGRTHGTNDMAAHVGDAVVWGSEHVGLVVAVYGNSFDVVNGNWGNSRPEGAGVHVVNMGYGSIVNGSPITAFVSPA